MRQDDARQGKARQGKTPGCFNIPITKDRQTPQNGGEPPKMSPPFTLYIHIWRDSDTFTSYQVYSVYITRNERCGHLLHPSRTFRARKQPKLETPCGLVVLILNITNPLINTAAIYIYSSIQQPALLRAVDPVLVISLLLLIRAKK